MVGSIVATRLPKAVGPPERAPLVHDALDRLLRQLHRTVDTLDEIRHRHPYDAVVTLVQRAFVIDHVQIVAVFGETENHGNTKTPAACGPFMNS